VIGIGGYAMPLSAEELAEPSLQKPDAAEPKSAGGERA
jgi:hypothetical protein